MRTGGLTLPWRPTVRVERGLTRASQPNHCVNLHVRLVAPHRARCFKCAAAARVLGSEWSDAVCFKSVGNVQDRGNLMGVFDPFRRTPAGKNNVVAGPCCFCAKDIPPSDVDPCRVSVETAAGKWQVWFRHSSSAS